MKAIDLRIGNWVYADTGLVCLEEHKILHADFIDLLKGKLRDKIKPIPLTEEWLIKCNVKKHHGYYEPFPEVWWHFDEDGKLSGSGEGLEHLIPCPQYVHEYQNLHYALKQEELVIT